MTMMITTTRMMMLLENTGSRITMSELAQQQLRTIQAAIKIYAGGQYVQTTDDVNKVLIVDRAKINIYKTTMTTATTIVLVVDLNNNKSGSPFQRGNQGSCHWGSCVDGDPSHFLFLWVLSLRTLVCRTCCCKEFSTGKDLWTTFADLGDF
jgi:hypothetical protein